MEESPYRRARRRKWRSIDFIAFGFFVVVASYIGMFILVALSR